LRKRVSFRSQKRRFRLLLRSDRGGVFRGTRSRLRSRARPLVGHGDLVLAHADTYRAIAAISSNRRGNHVTLFGVERDGGAGFVQGLTVVSDLSGHIRASRPTAAQSETNQNERHGDAPAPIEMHGG